MLCAAQHLKPWSLNRPFSAGILLQTRLLLLFFFPDWHHWCVLFLWLHVMIMSGTVDCTNKRPHTHTQTNQSKALKVDDVIVMQYVIRRRATSETHLYTCTTQTSSNTFIKSKRLSTHTRSRAVNSAVAQRTFYLDGPNERIWLRGKNCKTKWGSETIKFSKNKDEKKKKKSVCECMRKEGSTGRWRRAESASARNDALLME